MIWYILFAVSEEENVTVCREGETYSAQGGFSMLESLIGMALLSFILLGNSAFLILVIHANAGNRDLAAATFLGQDLAEDLKADPEGSARLVAGTPDCITLVRCDGPMDSIGTAVSGGKFTREWTVTRNNSLIVIDITVKWTSKDVHLTAADGSSGIVGGKLEGREHQISLSVARDIS